MIPWTNELFYLSTCLSREIGRYPQGRYGVAAVQRLAAVAVGNPALKPRAAGAKEILSRRIFI